MTAILQNHIKGSFINFDQNVLKFTRAPLQSTVSVRLALPLMTGSYGIPTAPLFTINHVTASQITRN